MSKELTRQDGAEIIEQVIARGDLKMLSPEERAAYYAAVCQSVGLNPLTKPFEYIVLNGRLTLYAKRDATDQLRSIKKVSVNITGRERMDDLYIVSARATMPDGRTDESIGVVTLSNLKGDALANALMKCETKAKRRVTLSICGLGLLDESEVETIPGTVVKDVATPEPTKPAVSLRDIPRPWSADVLVDALAAQTTWAEEHGKQPDEGLYGACLGLMEKAGDRHQFLLNAFGVASAKSLTPSQRSALISWLRPTKDEATGEWVPGQHTVEEFNAVIKASVPQEEHSVQQRAFV